MPARRLSADEAALWARVMAGVRPLVTPPVPRLDQEPAPSAKPPIAAVQRIAAKTAEPPKHNPRVQTQPVARATKPSPAKSAANTLDGTWDRHLARGLAAPDRTIDLHGHTLASAHAMLDGTLDQAVRGGDRVILLITGKPPRPTSERPHARGAIRAAVGDWLAGSRHSAAIAAVRPAHPRHGGAGALYIVLRKARSA